MRVPLLPAATLVKECNPVVDRPFGVQVRCHACVGGTSVREDARILQGGVHVVVGTPGRVYDMLRRRALRADSIRMFVLDEADEMLSRGFKDQIYDIFQQLPPKLQVCVGASNDFFSALQFKSVLLAAEVAVQMTCQGCHDVIVLTCLEMTCGLIPHVSKVSGNLALQVGVFSATLPPEALEITRKFMNKPVSLPTSAKAP